MKRVLLVAFALIAFSVIAFKPASEPSNEDLWTEDYAAAVKKAKAENKTLLLNFTGSDWCGWCIKLDREVFSQDAFKKYAEEELVLVKVDFPRKKVLPEATKQQNYDLQRKYMIRGYPTIILVDKDEKLVGQTGYQRGGADNYVEHLQKLIQKN